VLWSVILGFPPITGPYIIIIISIVETGTIDNCTDFPRIRISPSSLVWLNCQVVPALFRSFHPCPLRLQCLPQIRHELARILQKGPAPAESKLWPYLRGCKLNGIYFRRQQAIGKVVPGLFTSSGSASSGSWELDLISKNKSTGCVFSTFVLTLPRLDRPSSGLLAAFSPHLSNRFA
jgi:hypothetical protein